MEKIAKLRGMADILPQDQKYWNFVLSAFEKKVLDQGFEKIDTPIIENLAVFERPIGQQTEIVQKQLFEVKKLGTTQSDNENETPVLRPENTAGIIRCYLETGLGNLPQPVKLYYAGPMFRYDRPQKGRLRQFTQVGLEVIGDGSAASDSLVIFLTYQFFKALKLAGEIVIQVNSVGCKTCQPEISDQLKKYFQGYKKELCPDCQRRMEDNPRRILDCKQENCQKIAAVAPQMVDLICETCKKHFKEMLEFLEDLSVPYDLNANLVRGLDYYTRTTFEVVTKGDERRQNALAGGGRYDKLTELLGGPATPGMGMAAGVERIIELLKEKKVVVAELAQPQVQLIQLGPRARQKTLKILPELLRAGLRVFSAPGKESLKAQLRLADKKAIRLAVIIGEKEVFDNCAIVKDMSANSQESVSLGRLIARLKAKLRK